MKLGWVLSPLLEVLALDEPDVQLRWPDRAECPTTHAVEQRIDRLRSVGPRATKLLAQIDVREIEGRYTARIELIVEDETQTRRLEAPDCDAIADAVALIVALRVETLPAAPEVTPADPSRPDDAPALPAPEVEPTSDADPPPVSDSKSSSTGRLTPQPDFDRPRAGPSSYSAGLRLSSATGPWPGIGGGIGAVLGLDWRRLTLEFETDVGTGLAARVPDVGAGVRFAVVQANLSVGYRVSLGSKLQLAIRSGPSAGPILARGFGTDRDRWRVRPWVAWTIGLALERRLGTRTPWWFALGAQMDAALVRPSFSITPVGVVHQAPQWVLRTFVEIRWRRELASERKGVTPPA